jgi:hypothetical protein
VFVRQIEITVYIVSLATKRCIDKDIGVCPA